MKKVIVCLIVLKYMEIEQIVGSALRKAGIQEMKSF